MKSWIDLLEPGCRASVDECNDHQLGGAAATAPPTADDRIEGVMHPEPSGAHPSRADHKPARKHNDRRKLKKTATPGVYRKGRGYIVMYRAAGKQRKEYATTIEEARRIKRSRETDEDRGEFQAQVKVTLHQYAKEWIDRYQGNGRRGFREGTREEYRRLLNTYTLKYFKPSLRLTDITPRHLAQYVGWLADDREQGKHLSDSSIANATIPIRAMLSTAVREGLLRHNPAFGLALPRRDQNEVDDEEEEIRTLSRHQLATFLREVGDEHRMLFTLLAATGMRISEAIALRWRELYLDEETPHLRVRRALVKGRIEPPKTKHGRRRIPLSPTIARQLTDRRTGMLIAPQDEDLVFTSHARTEIDPDNLRRRVLKPTATKAGVGWAGFHAFRHTYASLMLARGANLLQLSRALGHHSPAFTLAVYAHLLQGEHAPALDLERELTPNPADASQTTAADQGRDRT